MIDLDAEFMREDVQLEINELDGKYNPLDRDTNVRIVEDVRKAVPNFERQAKLMGL